MELGGRRVLIGFDRSRTVARLEDDDLVIDDNTRIVMSASIAMPSVYAEDGGNVVTEIERHKAEDRIIESVITASNLADGQISPDVVFDKNSDPLDVPRGGTGLSNVPANSLLVGGGAAPMVPTGHVSFSNDTLAASSLTVGTWRYAASNNIHGRTTLAAVDSVTGCNVDLLLPTKKALSAPDITLTTASGQITMEAAVVDAHVRLVHFDWRAAPSDDRTSAQLALQASKSVVVSPDKIARYTATGLNSGSYDIRAACEDGRGTVSAVVKTTGTV